MARVIIALGSNLGDKFSHLNFAKNEMLKLFSILKTSFVYETSPEGYEAQDDFLNAVILAETELLPLELLDELQKIESLAKRERSFKNAPRTLDLDIIFYEGVEIKSERLNLPHLLWEKRIFVVEPMFDLLPEISEMLPFKLENLSTCFSLGKNKKYEWNT